MDDRELNAPLGYMEALWAGAMAGLAVDLTLYPLDTIKTRLQSQQGFVASGGFRKLYAGVPAISVGSAPSAALFFVSYEFTKRSLENIVPHQTYAHMSAACMGELVACLIRVPTEVLKQRAQAAPKLSIFRIVTHAFFHEGFAGFYRGYWSTIARELPFSFIEFPLWEYLKKLWSDQQGKPVSALQTAACGSLAGSVAAGLTTPLDVGKTRIMLSKKVTGERMTVKSVLTDIYRVKGYRGLFAGFWPRITWMALGGFVFFGAYDKAIRFFNALEPVETPERQNLLAYSFWYTEKLNRFWELLLENEDSKNKQKMTFEDSLNEAVALENRRQEFIDAAKRKFEKQGKI